MYSTRGAFCRAEGSGLYEDYPGPKSLRGLVCLDQIHPDPMSSEEHVAARFTDMNVGVTGKGGQYKMAFYNVHKSSMSMKLASNNVFWQSKVHLHSHKDYV